MTAVKFRSLMFREFRVSKKGIILQFGLLFAWIALTWGLLLLSGTNGLMGGALSGIADIIIMMTALYSAMYLLMDENFKADINSGWLKFSYALPITPLERTAARFVCRASVCLGSALIGLCHGAILCAYMVKPFGANYIVWYIVIFAAVMLCSLPSNIFTLRARSQEDFKKARSTAGLTMMGLLVVMVVVLFLAGGIDLKTLTESDAAIKLPVFTAAALAWAVPLLILMMAASFFTAYRSLRSAYQGAPKPERESSEGNEKTALPAKTDGAVGLLYKELKQNRLMLILAACVPVLFTAFPFCFTAIEVMTGETDVYKMFEMSSSLIIRVLVYVLGFFAVSALMTEVFSGDDKKLWAYFVVTLPQGVKGFMYRKYVITFMMNLIYMISGIFAEHILATLNYFVTGTELTTSIQGLYISGVFMLMFTNAFDIPFTVRYGSKKGSMIKMITLLSIFTAAILVYSLLLPDSVCDRITNTAVAILNGEANDIVTLILSICPYIALAAFLLSYKIACGVFMKGVNEYDK